MQYEHSGNTQFQKTVLAFMTLAALIMAIRLSQFSLFQSNDWKNRAQKRICRTMEIEPLRGRVLAEDGKTVMARSHVALSIAVDNTAIKGTNKECLIGKRLAEIAGVSPEEVISKIHSRHNAEWIVRDVDQQVTKHFFKVQLDGLLPGVHLKREIDREYPCHPQAASLLGFSTFSREPGFDTLGPFRHARGIEGLERSYNKELKGEFGQVAYQVNRFYAPEHDSYKTVKAVKNGYDLVTTVDLKIQNILRQELLDALELNAANTAMAMVMDPVTGAIIAAESVEDTPEHKDPEYRASKAVNCWPSEARRNLTHTSVFEPGSVWKPVMMAIALENNLVQEGDIIPWKPAVVMGGHAFKDWKNFNRDLLLKEVLIWSSNVGIIEVSRKMFNSLPPGQIYEQIRNMGFLRNLPVDYAVRPRGVLNPGNWSPITVGAVAEGYETGVTMSQLAAFYCAIANGGTIVHPHYGKHLLDPDTKQVARVLTPDVGYPIMSTETAGFIRNAMMECVDYGTGKKGNLKGFDVVAAGKTATAKLLVNGSYASGQYRASFCGFFPAENPAYVVVVSVENPTAGSYYGGQVAAPLFQNIAGRICADVHGLHIQPTPEEPNKQ